jgi:hypothetical protein
MGQVACGDLFVTRPKNNGQPTKKLTIYIVDDSPPLSPISVHENSSGIRKLGDQLAEYKLEHDDQVQVYYIVSRESSQLDNSEKNTKDSLKLEILSNKEDVDINQQKTHSRQKQASTTIDRRKLMRKAKSSPDLFPSSQSASSSNTFSKENILHFSNL